MKFWLPFGMVLFVLAISIMWWDAHQKNVAAEACKTKPGYVAMKGYANWDYPVCVPGFYP